MISKISLSNPIKSYINPICSWLKLHLLRWHIRHGISQGQTSESKVHGIHAAGGLKSEEYLQGFSEKDLLVL